MKLFVFVVIALIAAFAIPIAAVGYKNGNHMTGTLKTNRVYVSKEVFEKFKRENE